MALFDRKSAAESESEIDVTVEDGPDAPAARPAAPSPALGGPTSVRASSPAPAGPTSGRASVAPARYGVEQVLALMKALPLEQSPALVADVVKKTLESANISVGTIVDEARSREKEIQRGIEALSRAVEEMKEQIAARLAQVAQLRRELSEVAKVRELLGAPGKPGDGAGAGGAAT
ncbi:MAG: hypothetical protein HY744_26560 [Deltaproteobacteria bacterium]|nr:hypothetical protein [Deltaproteobacteria bacterium]